MLTEEGNGVKGFLWFFYYKKSEITAYWYADGNDLKRRETIDEAEEKMRRDGMWYTNGDIDLS